MTESNLSVTRQALDEMLEHFRKELPREGCGFLAGRGRTAFRYYPIHNINLDCRRFLMDPLHVQRTEVSIHRREQKILAVCHSHPEGDCTPSRWDVEGAFFDAQFQLPMWTREVQAIALMDPPDRPVVRAFRILAGGRTVEVGVEILPAPVGEISTCP